MFKYLISSHLNPTLSGVAKFNFILAQYLKIPCIGFDESQRVLSNNDSVLLSIKLKDINKNEEEQLKSLLKIMRKRGIKSDTFLHTFDELPIEYDIISQSKRVLCANEEIKHALVGFDNDLRVLWCPYLVDLSATLPKKKFNIFSFGMAHKLQLKHYKLLADKLGDKRFNYSVWISTAFHEKAQFGDFHEIAKQLISIFKTNVKFLGFLSDEAINYFLQKAQLFVAFFPKGVRANNTSIYVPMKKECPVLTNLDGYSPLWMKHGVNVLNIDKFNTNDLNKEKLRVIAQRAKKDVGNNASWELLIKSIKSNFY